MKSFLRYYHLHFTAVLLSILTTGGSLQAQDARLSQPWTTPLMINPALSGDFDGYVRVGGLTSYQENKVNKVAHQYGYLDNRVVRKNKDSLNAYWGLGLSYYQYGDDPFGFYKNRSPINARFYSLSLSYNFNLDKKKQHSMGFGVQASNVNGKLNESRGEYSKEISGGGFDYLNLNYPLVVNPAPKDKNYQDFNVGMYYRYRSETVTMQTGLSLFHIGNPSNDLVRPNGDSKEHHRAVMHVTLEIKTNPRNALLFKNIYYSEGLYYTSSDPDNNQAIANWMGIEVQRLRPRNGVFAHYGMYTRSFKTIMPYLSIHWGRNMNTRFSYEKPINLKFNSFTYNANRLEMAMIFTFYDKSKEARRMTPTSGIGW